MKMCSQTLRCGRPLTPAIHDFEDNLVYRVCAGGDEDVSSSLDEGHGHYLQDLITAMFPLDRQIGAENDNH